MFRVEDLSAITHVMIDSEGNAVGTSEDGTVFYAIGDVTVGKLTQVLMEQGLL